MKNLNIAFVSGCLLIAVMFVFITCTPEVQKTSDVLRIKKPFKALSVSPSAYTINCERDTVLIASSGTRINIPAHALVDANNNAIEGQVQMSFSEYHKPIDVLISGIPMCADSGGITYGFESAGMFNITASNLKGEAVFIKEGSSLNVNMASFRDGDDFTFYYLDTVSGQWQGLGTAPSAENSERKDRIDSLTAEVERAKVEKESIVKPKKYQKGDKILNLDIDYSRIPQLRPFHSLIWRYAGKGGADDPETQAWIYSEKWDRVSLNPSKTESGKYILKLGDQDKYFETLIEPVLHGRDLAKAEQELNKKMAEYDDIIDVAKREAARVEREASVVRSFSVSKFGIYNWDKFYKEPEANKVMADFKFDQNVPGADKAVIYLVIESRNAVIPYYSKSNVSFSFLSNERNKLIAVLPDERVAVFSTQDFKNISEEVYRDKNASYTFTLRVLTEKVNVEKDLAGILASL